MFDDFEDPFALPMEELKLAPTPQPTATKKQAPAYREKEVLALAAFGETGGLVQNGSYTLQTRRRLNVLRADLLRHRESLVAALKVRDEELDALASRLQEEAPKNVSDDSEGEPDERKQTLAALNSGDVGAILAAPALDAFSKARAVSRDTALHAAALNVVDDGAYRRGAELIALLTSFGVIALALLLLL